MHIHQGTSCDSIDQQGDPLDDNVWLTERYASDGNGEGTFQGIVRQGTADILGRAFIGKFF